MTKNGCDDASGSRKGIRLGVGGSKLCTELLRNMIPMTSTQYCLACPRVAPLVHWRCGSRDAVKGPQSGCASSFPNDAFSQLLVKLFPLVLSLNTALVTTGSSA